MDKGIEHALAQDRVIDITTTGRKTGRGRRIEIWFFNLEGRVYITGSPGRRSWYANLLANHRFTFHLKGTVRADLPAMARPIVNREERKDVLTKIRPLAGTFQDIDAWVDGSPLVEVTILESSASAQH